MDGWHKCHLCDCEFFDPNLDGYWGWCRDCRETTTGKKESPKKTKKGTTNEIRSKKHV